MAHRARLIESQRGSRTGGAVSVRPVRIVVAAILAAVVLEHATARADVPGSEGSAASAPTGWWNSPRRVLLADATDPLSVVPQPLPPGAPRTGDANTTAGPHTAVLPWLPRPTGRSIAERIDRGATVVLPLDEDIRVDVPPNGAPLLVRPIVVPTVRPAQASVAPRDPVDYVTPRFEPAGFPIIGGNTDIGVLFGVAGTLSRFQDGIRPYFWNMDLVLSASVKAPAGQNAQIVQQNYRWQWDIQGLFGGRLRLNPAAYYQFTNNQGYFGLGNASPGVAPAGLMGEQLARYFQFLLTEARVFQAARVRIRGPLSLSFALIYRYMKPQTYPGSQLEIDAGSHNPDGSPLVRGIHPTTPADPTGALNALNIGETSVRVIYDTRDSEIMPAHGIDHELWLRYDQGFPFDENVAYGAVGLNLAQYFTLAGPLIFASRFFADLSFGNVPFYDLFRGGTPFPIDAPGGGNGVRGVPSGRFLGQVKVVANFELRALLLGFHIFGQSFRAGASIFFDTGRVWLDYTFSNPRDLQPGQSPLVSAFTGLKWGAGAGVYIRWGQAAIFRVEMAYSPEASSENPGFPFGIYVSDGVMF